ncbi:MAG: tetratricopeptide repeat protein, partial [Leptolyngbya sp.]|nr:tetratricopeptide repeat protein [Candidatus Melainabacteria bacterium]
MKALVALSTLITCSLLLGLSACFAESGAIRPSSTMKSNNSVHTKAWLQEKLLQANSMLEKNNSDSKILGARAQIYFELKDYDKAIVDISKAIALDSKVQDYYYLRALSKGCKKQNKDAISDLSRAIEIGPARSSIHYQRAYFYSLLKDYSASAADAHKALQLDPKDYGSLVLLGSADFSQ